jgi:polar amino acid transport system substrate-binding protein
MCASIFNVGIPLRRRHSCIFIRALARIPHILYFAEHTYPTKGERIMKRLLGMALILVVIGGVAFAGGEQEEGRPDKITVATDATWPPMEFINEDKELVGFDIDLMNRIAEEAGFEVEFQNTAWDGIFAGLGAGEYDAVISSVTITEERQETMDFSEPYVNAGQVLIVRKETSGVTTLDDLEGEAVGAQIGTTGAIAIQEHGGPTLQTYDEIGLAIADLANGRIEGVVADTPIAANFALQNDEYADVLEIVGEPFTDEQYGVAVKEGNDEVLAMINEGLQAVKESGYIEELENKWLR